MSHILAEMSDIWWRWVVEASWQSAVVALVLILIVALGCRWPSPLRYALLLLALIKFIVPPLWTAPTGAFSQMPSVTESASVNSADGLEIFSSTRLVFETYESRRRRSQENEASSTTVDVQETPTTAASPKLTSGDAATATVTAQTQSWPWKVWLMLAHIAGSVVTAGLILRQAFRLQKVVRLSREVSDSRTLALTNELQQRIGLRRTVRLLESIEISSPVSFGVVRPTIILPASTESLKSPHLTTVLSHELTHLRRGDAWINWLQLGIAAVWWFHPVIWFLNRQLRKVREDCCDDTVLSVGLTTDAAYCETLLHVAAHSDGELAPSLASSMASRQHPVAGRLRRIMDANIRRSVRLSLVGVFSILLLSCIVLPGVADTERTDDTPTAAASESEASHSAEPPEETGSPVTESLRGRIIDDTGAPVTDAEIALRGAENKTAKTDENGNYSFPVLDKPGEYRVQIQSSKWVGLTNWDRMPRLQLSPEKTADRDFTLERAGWVKLLVANEQGEPLKNVEIYSASLSDEKHGNTEAVRTDEDGVATVGGLTPSKDKYIFGLRHDDYAITRFASQIEKPGLAGSFPVIMEKGANVEGSAICSDGKPPAGWRILAMPSWWHFGVTPQGEKIAEDGSFTLTYIARGNYNVTIAVPSGEHGSRPETVLTNTQLLEAEGPLTLKMKSPSPESMVYISGGVTFKGNPGRNGVWIHARSLNGKHSTSDYVRNDDTTFRLGPVPKGAYRIAAEAPEIESVILDKVTAPTEDLKLTFVVRGKPQIHGQVVLPYGKPATRFRIKVNKIHTLRGPNYVGDNTWKDMENADGRFQVEAIGPGIYTVTAMVPGLAPVTSGQYNTDDDSGNVVSLKLEEGRTLTGMVVDEQGNPVSDATVVYSSQVTVPPDVLTSPKAPLPVDESTKTQNGKFTLKVTADNTGIIRVIHPAYSISVVERLADRIESGKPLAITLTSGATIRGHVFDAGGVKQPNVRLEFAPGVYMAQRPGFQLATAVTDADGYYEVNHLPERMIHIYRTDFSYTSGTQRMTAKVRNGETHDIDFGGPRRTAGRIIVNGRPLSDVLLQIGESNTANGMMQTFATTDSAGNFQFQGVPPGRWMLYCDLSGDQRDWDWGAIREMTIGRDADTDLGEIHQTTGQLKVVCQPNDPEIDSQLQVTLTAYDPMWSFGRGVGALLERTSSEDPFTFHHVPPGDYLVNCVWRDHLETQQRVHITENTLNQTLNIALPVGTASLDVKIGKTYFADSNDFGSVRIRSQDSRWETRVYAKTGETKRFDNLPAATWLILDQDIRQAPAVRTVELTAGEARTVTLEDVDRSSMNQMGYRIVRVSLPNGTVIPCRISLQGPDGPIASHTSQHGSTSFAAAPGMYQLSVALPGYKTVQQPVELFPVGGKRSLAEDFTVEVRLQPL